jgi:hypothetical protein
MLANQIITVIFGILAIFGLLLVVSRLGFRTRIDWRIGLGIPLSLLSLFVLTTELPQYGNGFSIIGTLILAGAALMAIKQNDEQIRSDRQERKLATIIAWATDIAKCETAVQLTPLPLAELAKTAPELDKTKLKIIIEYYNKNTMTNLIMRYQNLEAMQSRIVLTAKILDKQFGSNLGFLAQQTAEKLQEHVKLGSKFIAEEITNDEYREHWKSLLDSAISLAEKAEEVAD